MNDDDCHNPQFLTCYCRIRNRGILIHGPGYCYSLLPSQEASMSSHCLLDHRCLLYYSTKLKATFFQLLDA